MKVCSLTAVLIRSVHEWTERSACNADDTDTILHCGHYVRNWTRSFMRNCSPPSIFCHMVFLCTWELCKEGNIQYSCIVFFLVDQLVEHNVGPITAAVWVMEGVLYYCNLWVIRYRHIETLMQMFWLDWSYYFFMLNWIDQRLKVTIFKVNNPKVKKITGWVYHLMNLSCLNELETHYYTKNQDYYW